MTIANNQNSIISFAHDTPELAKTYDATSDRQFEHGKGLVASLNLQPGEHVLDVGAGTGRLAEHVAGIVGPSGRVVAVDPLPLRIELAGKRARGRFETQIAQAEDLSAFPDESFDAVYLNSVFHWVEDKPRALAEAWRVLKKGGRIALNTQNTDRPHEVRQVFADALAATGLPFSPDEIQPIVGIPQAELEPLFTIAGFVNYSGTLRELDTPYPDLDKLIALSTSSSFGNFLSAVPADQQVRLLEEVKRLLEPYRNGDAYTLKRYLTFATADKPAS